MRALLSLFILIESSLPCHLITSYSSLYCHADMTLELRLFINNAFRKFENIFLCSRTCCLRTSSRWTWRLSNKHRDNSVQIGEHVDFITQQFNILQVQRWSLCVTIWNSTTTIFFTSLCQSCQFLHFFTTIHCQCNGTGDWVGTAGSIANFGNGTRLKTTIKILLEALYVSGDC